jgi:hypothetical protein
VDEEDTVVCAFRSPTEVMVCDVAVERVRRALEATFPATVTLETVHGQGTLVRCLDPEREDEFRALVERSLAS